MTEKNKLIYAIAVFYVIAIIMRYLTNKVGILSGIDNDAVKIILQGIGPTLGVLIASLIFKIKFSMTLKGNHKQALIPFLFYWLLPIVLISAHTFLYNKSFPILTVFMFFIYGLLEEIGWRGFLQQQLKSLPKILNILIVAILWFIWHLNFDITITNLLFLGLLILGSWGIGVVADKTNSLLAVSAFHTLNNVKTEQNLILIGIFVILWITLIVYMDKKSKKRNSCKISKNANFAEKFVKEKITIQR
ncbi:MAG: CPBP family intramembrane metalloprotease [Prevotellaceae bacterium]|jgi:membrane protease YdiL (CAAX protease family)|nr:CPBP family intramembrane metalloprotease [Prevotellaceae bacterium]